MENFYKEIVQYMTEIAQYKAIIFFVIACYVLYHMWFKREVAGEVRLLEKQMKPNWFNIACLLAAALVVKALFAVNYEGYTTDMTCFKAWSDMIYDNGISKFYYVDEGNGYPPGYMFVLWCMAVFRHIFGIETGSDTGVFLIKLFPILCDLGAAFVIYLLAKKRFSEGVSLMLSTLYALNPMMIIDSSMWGQVDSVFTLTVLLTCYLCMEQKRIPAYFVFCLGALLKFQTIMFAPILIFTIIEQVFLNDFSVKKMVRDLIGGLSAIAAMFLFAVPFGLDVVVPKYVNSLGLFEYCTVNAYNFWMIMGKNWVAQTEKFLFLPCETWGNLAIVVAVLLSAFVFFRMKQDKSKYFVSMVVLISCVFLFSVRMHERYLFPAIVLMLAAFLYHPTKEFFYAFVGFSVVQFINTFHVYYTFMELGTTGPEGYIMGATAVLTIFYFGYVLYGIFRKGDVVFEPNIDTGKDFRKKKKARYAEANTRAANKKEKFRFAITPSKPLEKIGRIDLIVLFSIMLVYSCFALYDLGDMSAPESGWESFQNGGQIVLDFGETRSVTKMYSYPGCFEDRKFTVETSNDGVTYENKGVANIGSVFRWNDVKLSNDGGENSEKWDFNLQARWLRLTSLDNESIVKELLFKDGEGNEIVPANASEYAALFDEQDEFDPEMGFRSGTYFDEIYHGRTAYEMIHEYRSYENTHPPLGKFFISLGVRMFGMTPFGWRIIGTLFGIGMLPFMYMFGKRLFGKTWLAGIVTTLFAFDFMHFTQTRIATIDVYGTFFIIAMFYFMLRYSQTSFYDTDFKKTLIPLGLSGLMMGLGCASKWTAIYAGAGLGIYFFGIMIRRYMEFRLAQKNPNGETAGISHSHIIDGFQPLLIKTLVACVVFFIVIPGLIYLLSYIPFQGDSPKMGLWERMIANQEGMFSYHSQLVATHPYSSLWYEWPTMIRPVFYYSNTVANDLREGISAFGNPLVWWAGIFAFAYMIYRIFAKHDRTACFLSFAYLVQYLPWMLVSRCTFAYHYFPSVPFVALMVVYSLYCFIGDDKKKRIFGFAYCGAAVALFVMFYPVLSGQPVALEYVTNGLKWLSGWVLIL